MCFAVFGVSQSVIDNCFERAAHQLKKKKYLLVNSGGGRRLKTEITDANREVLTQEIGNKYAAKLKPRKIETFDAPQFCADWIEIANKTRAPFSRLEIRVLSDREFVPMNYNRIEG